MDNDLKLPVGARVTVADRLHPYGPAFLAGPGTVLENPDVVSRLRGDVVIRFDKGVTGIFKLPVDLPLISLL